jgi:sarcosine oxidase / L-pipecolate oxidase
MQPNPDNLMKLAVHSMGYTHRSASALDVSTPRTTLTHGDQEGSRIPKAKVRELRNHLRSYYPELADTKPFVKTRLCWYVQILTLDKCV